MNSVRTTNTNHPPPVSLELLYRKAHEEAFKADNPEPDDRTSKEHDPKGEKIYLDMPSFESVNALSNLVKENRKLKDLMLLKSFSKREFLKPTLILVSIIILSIALIVIFSYLICKFRNVGIVHKVVGSALVSCASFFIVSAAGNYVLNKFLSTKKFCLFSRGKISFWETLFNTIFGGPSPFGRDSNMKKLDDKIALKKEKIQTMVASKEHNPKTAIEKAVARHADNHALAAAAKEFYDLYDLVTNPDKWPS